MKRRTFLHAALGAVALVALIGAFSLNPGFLEPTASQALSAQLGTPSRELRSLDGAVEWINSPPLTASSLRGKVVLVEFWTYTCINWMRSNAYVRVWAEKYRDRGLVVVGAHTPEFSFESDLANVRRAAKALQVDYPIAVDSRNAIWNGFSNQYWPALYLIDAQGRVRYQHFGEGEYEKSEKMIQQLLSEAGNTGVSKVIASIEGRGVEAAADWNNLKSPETYLGYARTERFSSPGGGALNKPRDYTAPGALRLNEWALAGNWTMGEEAAASNRPNARVVYRFHARDVHLVMGSGKAGTPVRFRVLVDGQPPGAAQGLDTDRQGNGLATEPRLYQLIRQPKVSGEHTFQIEFLDPGARIYAFTFG